MVGHELRAPNVWSRWPGSLASRQYPFMLRREVQHLVALGRMPSELDDPPQALVDAYVAALDALSFRLTDDEAAALLDVFPPERAGLYEVEWSLVHAIESAPYGPGFLRQLDDRSWWVKYLRERAERGGLL